MLNLLFIFKGPYVTNDEIILSSFNKGSTHHNMGGVRVSIFLLRVRDKILPSN